MNIIKLLGELTKNNVPWYILSCGGNREHYLKLIEMANTYQIRIQASGEIWMGYEGEDEELYRVPEVKGGMNCNSIPDRDNDKIKGLNKLMGLNPFLEKVKRYFVDDTQDNITALNPYFDNSIRPGADETVKIIAVRPHRISATFFVYYGSDEHYDIKNILNNHTGKIDQIYGWLRGLRDQAQPSPHLPPEHSPPAGPQEEKIALFFDFDETLICKAHEISKLPEGYIHVGEDVGKVNIITSQVIIDLLVLCTSNDNIDWYIVSSGDNLNVLELLIRTYAEKGIIIRPTGIYFNMGDNIINNPEDKARIIGGIMKEKRYSQGIFVDDKQKNLNAVEQVENINSPAVNASNDWTLEDSSGKGSLILFTIPGDSWDPTSMTVGIQLISGNTINREIMPHINPLVNTAAQGPYQPPAAQGPYQPPAQEPYQPQAPVGLYDAKIAQLMGMGYSDPNAVLAALTVANGDVNLAKDYLPEIVAPARGAAYQPPPARAPEGGPFYFHLISYKYWTGPKDISVNKPYSVTIKPGSITLVPVKQGSESFKFNIINSVEAKEPDDMRGTEIIKQYPQGKLTVNGKRTEDMMEHTYQFWMAFDKGGRDEFMEYFNRKLTRGGNKRRSTRRKNTTRRKINRRRSRKKNTTKRRVSKRRSTKKRYSRKK